jgi:F-box interacting protein
MVLMMYGFGYDHVTNNYKVVVVLQYYASRFEMVEKTEVKIHTLGTNFWKSIQEFPFGGVLVQRSGVYVSGTINWLACKDRTRQNSPCFIFEGIVHVLLFLLI